MSAFMGNSPVLRLTIRNPFLDLRFPAHGTVLAVVDTGYDGFLAVPKYVFSGLGLESLSPMKRVVMTADGRPIKMVSSLASIDIPGLPWSRGGAVESADGIGEILAGTRLLREFKVTLDYCVRVARLESCR